MRLAVLRLGATRQRTEHALVHADFPKATATLETASRLEAELKEPGSSEVKVPGFMFEFQLGAAQKIKFRLSTVKEKKSICGKPVPHSGQEFACSWRRGYLGNEKQILSQNLTLVSWSQPGLCAEGECKKLWKHGPTASAHQGLGDNSSQT